MMKQQGQQHSSPYKSLLLMGVLSFVAMYALMYAMVDRLANVYPNLNQAYMAGLMAAPMILIELVVMRAMYRSVRANIIAAGTSLALFLVCYGAIRGQSVSGS